MDRQELRESVAAIAMSALLESERPDWGYLKSADAIAKFSVELADALLAELDRDPEEP